MAIKFLRVFIIRLEHFISNPIYYIDDLFIIFMIVKKKNDSYLLYSWPIYYIHGR